MAILAADAIDADGNNRVEEPDGSSEAIASESALGGTVASSSGECFDTSTLSGNERPADFGSTSWEFIVVLATIAILGVGREFGLTHSNIRVPIEYSNFNAEVVEILPKIPTFVVLPIMTAG